MGILNSIKNAVTMYYPYAAIIFLVGTVIYFYDDMRRFFGKVTGY